ncbi:MAG: hypothetical protein Salg2KO_03650 [Salibacteraceae bacterium]
MSKWKSIFVFNALILIAGILSAELYLQHKGIVAPFHHPFAIKSMEPGQILLPDSALGVELRDGTFSVWLNSGLSFKPSHKNGERLGAPTPIHPTSTVWLYGCSFLYGFGLADSQVVGAKLSALLHNYAIRNRSVPGYGNVQMYLKMLEDQPLWQPGDKVIMTYAPFHGERNAMLLSYRNKLYTFGKNKLAQVSFPQLEETGGKTNMTHKVFDYPAFPWRASSHVMYGLELLRNQVLDNPEQAKAMTRQFLQQVAQHFKDGPYLVAIARLSYDAPTLALFDTLHSTGIPTLDLSLDFSDTGNNLMPLDAHPNETAHAYFANQIAQWITKP